jgi:hypothetical protein
MRLRTAGGFHPFNLTRRHINDRAKFGFQHVDIQGELMSVCSAQGRVRRNIALPIKYNARPALPIGNRIGPPGYKFVAGLSAPCAR